ncbi:MAG TPA: hypothetical protein VMO26_19480 [Vicinamibacterales bacterium]|nr:hypothetical protein [Vicinamibacterales bacterium]
MRLTFILALLFFPASLAAQPSPCTESSRTLLPFDPYKPSDLAIVRNYGGAVLAQAPLESLLKLDPYVPTEAALLRQLGSAIPFWAYADYPFYRPAGRPAPHASPCEPVRETTAPVLTALNDVLAVLERQAPAATGPTAATVAERNRGVSIQHDGRMWISAGPAVRFSATAFVRIGERAGSPIFRRVGGEDTVIYIPTTAGMVAPFRAVP